VDDCKPREQLADLIGAAQTAANSLVDRERRHILAKEADAPCRRRKVASDRVKQRRLSGAIRAKNRPPLAGLNPKVDVGEGDKGAELAADALELQRKRAVGREAFGGAAVDHCGRASLPQIKGNLGYGGGRRQVSGSRLPNAQRLVD